MGWSAGHVADLINGDALLVFDAAVSILVATVKLVEQEA